MKHYTGFKPTVLTALTICLVLLAAAAGQDRSANPGPIHERIEWTDIWVTDANKDDLPRVLFVGDSIVRGYFNHAEKELDGVARCGRLTTSAFISHEDFLSNLRILLNRFRWDVIHINNGLHGWDYTEQQYADGFAALGDLLKEHAGEATIIWALTTPLRERGNLQKIREDSNERVQKRNQIASAFAKQHGWGVSDLYSLSIDHSDHHRGDGTHFSKKGIASQGKFVSEIIRTTIDSRQSNPHAADAGAEDVSYETDFESGIDEWQIVDADCWRLSQLETNHVLSLFQKKGAFEPVVRSLYHLALLNKIVVGDFQLDARVRSTEPDYAHRDACLIFGYQSPTRYYYAHFAKQTDSTAHQIQIVNGKDRTAITLKNNDGTPWDDNWHRIRVTRDVDTGEIAVYFDDMDTPSMTAVDKTFTWGRVGVGSFDDTADFDDVKLVGKLARLK